MASLLDRNRQQAVFEHVQRSILAGVFSGGARLPATRALSEELGVARQTVVFAYERLIAEGYAEPRLGVGTFVARALPDARPDPVPTATRPPAPPRLSRRGQALAAASVSAGQDRATLLLAPGVPAPELFPARAWAACFVAGARDHPLSGYPDPQGLPALRAQIAHHLAASRGLVVEAKNILITAGTQQALRIAADLLLDPGDLVWIEDPGYIAGRGAMEASGATLVPIPSGPAGLDVAAGRVAAPLARLALVAPSHSTPLGGALPVAGRLALLDWARTADARILEDDCDSEFRWEGKPLPPLATLDATEGAASRVVYCGTFSKTLAPGLRLGFAVFPPALIAPAIRARTLMDRGPSTPVQAAAAELMRRGLLGPHIRKARTEYARRRNALLEALARHAPSVTPVAAPGGLHMALLLQQSPHAIDETAITGLARTLGLNPAPLGAYRLERGPPGLVVGFAATPAALAAGCAKRLEQAIQASRSQ